MSQAIKDLANAEKRQPNSCWAEGAGCSDRIRVVAPELRIEKSFVKPAGVTTLKLEITAPVNRASTQTITLPLTSIYPIFRFNLYKTHYYTKSTDEKIIEDITVSSSNTDKALTSADIPEIRRNQIQTIYFSGFQAIPHTGDYSSEYSISGSGIVTQIFFDNQIQSGLDFENYVVTGYNTASIMGDLAAGKPIDYSAGYENPDGANLIWAIEPADSDITSAQNYTMDEEFSSGHSELYRVINIQENEKKYDISALEYSPIKYEATDIGGGGTPKPPPGPCMDPSNPRISGEDSRPPEYCCDGSVKDPIDDCIDTMVSTGDGDVSVGWELDPNCNEDGENPTKLGSCCVRCGEEGHPNFEVNCYDNVTYEECMEWEERHNSVAARTRIGG
jgi:hypothetical protein